ncbi:hypothetical protein WKV44_07465 [Spirochaetia bacterium 38H-sp]|uniref:Uncharacterized protein n=1 Tax=Rarispira pelagica TaxID=3141764 RepID=A0ABU9UCJ4_9SPIR
MILHSIPVTRLPAIKYLNSFSSALPVTVPVKSPGPVMIRLNNVIGIPAVSDDQGVSLDKLQMLDVLIERFSKISHKEAPVKPRKDLPSPILDAMVKEMESRLHAETVQNFANPMVSGTKELASAVLVNISA